jgi:hypothetical protein
MASAFLKKVFKFLKGEQTVTMREIKVKETLEKSRSTKREVGGELLNYCENNAQSLPKNWQSHLSWSFQTKF